MYSTPAPAKINLSLRLLGPRPDGFTELESLVLKVDWCDQVAMSFNCNRPPGGVLSCNWPELTARPQDNLVWRAFDGFWQALGKPPPGQFELRLTKRIPHQAGLGGGSSDAAATLRLLNRWCRDNARPTLSPDKLAQLAAQLGSDVPMFLRDDPLLWVTGRGEHLAPASAELIPAHPCLIVKPMAVGIATAQAYQQVHARRIISSSQPLASLTEQDWPRWSVNDFERALYPEQPELRQIVYWLKALGATHTLLCGSGSAIAAWFPVPIESDLVAAMFPYSRFRWRWVQPWQAISRLQPA